MPSNNLNPEIISRQKAINQFKLENYFPLNKVEVSVVIVMDGNTHIKEDLDSWYENLLSDNSEYDDTLMVIINGDLKVDGIVTGKEDYNAHLLVLGDLYCDFLRSNDEVSWVTGNANVKYVFDGNYNDGSIVIEGILNVPYLLNSDHSSNVNPSKNTILIGYFGEDGHFNYDVSFNMDFTKEDVKNILIPEIYSLKYFNRDAFYEVVKSNKSPFVEGFKIERLSN